MRKVLIIILILSSILPVFAQKSSSKFRIARVKYSGGGDWYNDPSAEANLLRYIGQHTNIPVEPVYEYVELSSDNLFLYPMIFITGHGDLRFSDAEVRNLRSYLENGGFLFIDDDYGLDEYIREEMKKVFPNKRFVELPFTHGIYHCHYDFSSGPPKTHEHDDNPPKGYGMFIGDRMAIYYTFESNPSDGWADQKIHKDPPEKREESLKFGVNIVVWALMN